ncbi:MAG: tail fiber domain-containing protein, partial [Candidatus Moraniibacteriota bacterium]
GNVGIGTTAPGATLHAYGVAGANRIMGISDLALDTTDPWQGSVQIKTAPTGNNWLMSTVAYAASSKGVRFYNTGGVASYTSFEVVQGSGSKFIVDGLGNVGIGTTTPGARLSVLGVDSLSTSFAANISGLTGTGLVVKNNGNVGIGTTSPLSKLDVNGAIKYVDGTGDSNTAICKNSLGQLAPCSSLGALKNSVQDLGLGMETLMKLRPVKFNWNASGEKDLGFIAEEVASVNPLLAVYSKTGKLQGVKYPQLTSLLTSAVQEQQTQITGMTDQMSALGASFHITNSAGTVISFGNREIGALQNRDMTITADTISLNGNVIANGQNLNSAITGITENQNKIVEQLTGQLTDQNLSVDNKLQLIGASLNELTTKQVKTLKDQIAVEKKDISDLQKQMEDIQIQNKAFNDFLLAFDVKNIDNFAKKNAPLNTFTGKISATDIEALGTVKAETLDGQKLKLGAQISGTNVIKAGKLESVKILTTEASTNIKLYLTPKGPTQGKTLYYDEDDIDSGVGFKVKIEAPDLDKDIEFNWLIVK